MAQTLLRYSKTTIRINESRLNLVQRDSETAAGDSQVRSKNKSTVGNETDSPVNVTVSSKEDLQHPQDETCPSHLKRRIAR